MGLKDNIKNAWKRVADLDDESEGAENQAKENDRIPYKEISKKLKEVMKQNVDVVGRRILIPSYYAIYFNELDRKRRVDVENVLCDELKEELFPEMRKINPEQNKREITIEIKTDSSLERGQFRIIHGMKKPTAEEEKEKIVKIEPTVPEPPVDVESDFKETIIEQAPQPITDDEQVTIIRKPESAVQYKLVVDSGEDTKEVNFTKDTISIGRGSKDDVILPSPDYAISRSHAVIEVRDGECYLTSLGINGTSLNGEELELKKEVQITPGDEIKIMHFTLKLIQ